MSEWEIVSVAPLPDGVRRITRLSTATIWLARLAVLPMRLALGFQTVAVASLGFLAWFWLMTIYPAASVASFSFLSPVFSVLLGWLLLSENVAPSVWAALVLVAAGIYLINRRPRIAAAG